MDFMVIAQDDDGEIYPPFGVVGGTDQDAAQKYKQFRTDDTEDDAIYTIKANAPINTEAYSATQSALDSGKVKFLIETKQAKVKLLGTKKGQAMTPEERNEYLLPFSLTDILRDELLNLRQKNEGVNIILEKANKNVGSDKVSSLIYGIYYIREFEDNKKRAKRRFKDFMFLN